MSTVYIAQKRLHPWPKGGGIPFDNVHDALDFTNSKENQGTDSVATVTIHDKVYVTEQNKNDS